MIRLSKLADYGIVLMTYFAGGRLRPGPKGGSDVIYTSRELADESRLPLPTVSKIMKALCRSGLLMSHRGAGGGYSLAREPDVISVVDIIAAIEGPIAMTECSITAPGLCEFESACPVRSNWQRINNVVVQALAGLSLTDMKQPLPHTAQLNRPKRMPLKLVERNSQ
jgi:FeS assembly SUF system regulator